MRSSIGYNYSQVNYAIQCIRGMLRKNLQSINVKPEVAEKFSSTLDHELSKTVWSQNCHSWYQNAMGKASILQSQSIYPKKYIF